MGRRAIVRAPGAVEQTIDVHIYRTAVQFSLVAELGHPVSAEDLAYVLAALQDRHPVLRMPGGVIPIEVAADGTPWEYVVVVEQTRPLPPASGPPARALLVPGDPGCAVVLTVAHQIIDDAGGPQTVLDLVLALGGPEPGPTADPHGPHPDTGGSTGRTPYDLHHFGWSVPQRHGAP